MNTSLELKVNGRIHQLQAASDVFLVDVLREQLGLTGTKYACGMGECGACTVLLDGKPVYSCLTLAIEAQGQEITTIEGLASERGLYPVQQAMEEMGGVQCGFCTPGMVLSIVSLLAENPHPSDSEIRMHLSGNLCRCTGYVKIVEAARAASEFA